MVLIKKNNIKYFLLTCSLFVFFVLSPTLVKSQSPTWAWAKDVHTNAAEWATDIAVDTTNGEAVVVGVFNSDLSGFFGLGFFGAIGGGFVAKYDANGNVIWAFSIGNNQDDACNGVTISPTGNIYVTGYFQNIADFKGKSLLSTILTSVGGKDIFLAKYSPNGQLVWVRKAGGSFDDEGFSVTTNTNNIFVTGYFINSGSFSGIPTGSNAVDENMFVACYDSNGNAQWESDAGSGQSCFGRDITADNNAIYVTGDFKNSSLDLYDNVGGYFGSVLNSVASKEDGFVMSLNTAGQFLWANGIHSANTDFGRGIAQSGSSVYLTGSISSGANFPSYSGNPVNTTGSGLEIYLAQVDKISGLTNWVRSESGPGNEEGTSITIDTASTICLTGYFDSGLSFSGGPTISTSGNEDVFVANYSSAGNIRWVTQAGANGKDKPHGIASNINGDIYVAGEYPHTSGTLHIGYDTAITGSIYSAIGLIQLDTNGHFDWIRFIGNNTLSTLTATITYSDPITIDGTNNTHYFCYLKSGLVFMPGDTSHYGVYDVSYDISGTLLSAIRLDLDSQWILRGVVIDPVTNKLYACGEINTSLGTETFFAAALDASRNLLWQYFAGHGDDDAFTGIT